MRTIFVGDVVCVERFSKGWSGGLPETKCGAGSTLKNTEQQRKWIPKIIEKYAIGSIADIGAGDLNWIREMDLSGVDYSAYDLVPRAKGVTQFNLVEQVAPRADMIMCLWVLNHLPMEDSRNAISNLKASGSKYLLMTDRPKWHSEQPDEIHMPHIEELVLNDRRDRLVLIEL